MLLRHQGPWYDLAEKRYKCKSFAIDLHLPPDKNDPRLIEGDATDMPFDDESISKIALHSAYEMFENEADINLIKEANRVLTGGKNGYNTSLYGSSLPYSVQS